MASSLIWAVTHRHQGDRMKLSWTKARSRVKLAVWLSLRMDHRCLWLPCKSMMKTFNVRKAWLCKMSKEDPKILDWFRWVSWKDLRHGCKVSYRITRLKLLSLSLRLSIWVTRTCLSGKSSCWKMGRLLGQHASKMHRSEHGWSRYNFQTDNSQFSIHQNNKNLINI